MHFRMDIWKMRFMKIPEGYDEVLSEDVEIQDFLILQNAIYGLVQAARQFWKKVVDKRWKKEVFSSVKLIHACCTEKMKMGFVSSLFTSMMC